MAGSSTISGGGVGDIIREYRNPYDANYDEPIGPSAPPQTTLEQAANLQVDNNKWLFDLALQQQQAEQNSADRAMQFSKDEAAAQRAWSEYMSNTAYQRAVVDMKKAGLNPALMFSSGASAASSPSGSAATGTAASMSKASADTQTMASILGTLLSNESAESIAADKNKVAIFNNLVSSLFSFFKSGKSS